MSLKDQFEAVVKIYALRFCLKQDLVDPYWVGDNIGGLMDVADMFLDLDVIRFDIDNNIPEGLILKWYWSDDLFEGRSNYQSWLKRNHPHLFYDKAVKNSVL